MGDQKLVAETRSGYAKSLVAVGKTEKVPEILFGAIDYFRKQNMLQTLGESLSILGQSYQLNGNFNKALEHFTEAKKVFAVHNNDPQTGMITTEIASTYLLLKQFDIAFANGTEAEKILTGVQYEYGLASNYTFWGQYYTEMNDFKKAESYFAKAAAMASKNNFTDKVTDNMRYWAILKRKQKSNKSADSLDMSYAERIVKEREQAVIMNELKENISRNKITDTNAIRLLSVMYSPGGVDKLKKQLNGHTLSDIIALDSISLTNASFNPSENITRSNEFNQQLLNVETRYKTKLITDSLTIEKKNNLLAKQEANNKAIIIWFIAGLCVLLAAGFWLQYKSRKKADLARQKIELLQNEIHHRVKNNLGVINRLVEVASKNVTDDIPLSTLKSRIKSIELLHKHLYSQTAATGKISLHDYVNELCKAISNTFEQEEHPVQLSVNATGEVEQPVAEKLGLIINELVTNAYKYAFVGKENGNIAVEIRPGNNEEISLVVKDNGAGIDIAKSKGYGMKLIKGLTHELGGNGIFSNENGTVFKMSFPATA